MIATNAGSSSHRRSSVATTPNNISTFSLATPDVFIDSRNHGYKGPSRHVRFPRATTHGGGSIAKSDDGVRCVVAGRESLRILRTLDMSGSGSLPSSDHKSVTGRGGHRVEASRNFWDGSGLKVDSSSTDVAWCHGVFSNKILTSARNGELIMWDLNKNGSSKYERRVRDHARSIHVLQYSPILQSYCITGSADGDIRIWDVRDLTKSIMRIHHPAAIRSVAFSPVSSQSRHVVAALENGSIHRWDLTMGQRGQLDRIPVAHSGPILSLDWVPPLTLSGPTASTTRQASSSNWYVGPGAGFFEDILPSVPIAGGNAPTTETENSSPGWIVSGGMDRTVKVWDLSRPATSARSHQTHQPAYTLHTPFPVRRVLFRPGYECELAVVSNADFGTGVEFGHSTLGGPSSGGSTGLSSPRISPAHLGGIGVSGNKSDGSAAPEARAKSSDSGGSDPVEIWDVRRGYIAKWVVNGSAIEGGVTDIDFADSHALWTLHQSGTFSQLDLRQCRRPLDAIPRAAVSWNTSGSIAFVTDRPKQCEVPYDDVDPESKPEKGSVKALGDQSYRPSTQSVGAYAPEGAAEDLDTIEKLAKGYIYTHKSKAEICTHNAEVAIDAGAHDAAQTWLLLASLLTDLIPPPTPPLSPLQTTAAMPMVSSLPQSPYPKERSPGSLSKYAEDRHRRSTSRDRGVTVTPPSSNSSSPRKLSSGLPSVPAAIFARRESNSGLPPPLRPRLPSFRRPSFSATQSILSSTQGESPNDSMRSSHASLRHVGEGALDDSDSDESGSEHEYEDEEAMEEHHPQQHSPRTPSRGGAVSPFSHRGSVSGVAAHPSPLSRLALTGPQQAWTEDERDDEDSPSPGSTSGSDDGEGYGGEDESDDARRGDEDDERRGYGGGAGRRIASRMSGTHRRRHSSASRSRTRSRSSPVASFVSPTLLPLPRKLTKQESQSSIRTVLAGDTSAVASQPSGGLRRDETIKDLAGARAASLRGSLHNRGASSGVSSDFGMNEDERTRRVVRVQSNRTKNAVRQAEARLRGLAWGTMRERFEQYCDEGDIIMCAMLSLILQKELRIARSRRARCVEAYIDILSRLRLHTCAAYIRKYVDTDPIRVVTSMATTIYSTCAKCRKPMLAPAAPMVQAGKPSGSYAYCIQCRTNVTKCTICHLPVRALMFQCPVCMHGGHQDCYQAYYMHRPPEEIAIAPPSLSMRTGRSADISVGSSRGRAFSRTNSTYTADGESDDGASTQGDGTTGSWESGRGVVVSSPRVALGRICAAGCGHHCWAAEDKGYAAL